MTGAEIKSIANKLKAITGREPEYIGNDDHSIEFNVRCYLTDAQFERIDILADKLGIDINTWN